MKKIFKFVKTHLLFISIGLYLSITAPALLDPNHFLYNLEPYPDGLLYSLSGRNFWLGKSIALISSFGQLKNWVPPLYSLILGLGTFIFAAPASFYITNILINSLSIIIFNWILNKSLKKDYAKLLGMALFFSHTIIFWLPSIPITENITLLFFLIIIASFYSPGWKKYALMLLGITGMILTRYSVFPVAVSAILIPAFLAFKKTSRNKKILIITLISLFLTVAFWFLSFQKISALGFVKTIFRDDSPWYGIRFIVPNLVTYAKMLFLSKGLFLWLNVGLTNFILFGMFVLGIVVLYKKKKWLKFWILTILFLAQLPLQLVFYVADARYLIYSIPLIIIGTVWLVDAMPKKKKVLIPLVTFGILLQLFMQRNLVRQIIADNFLGRSTAWQYEAVKHFNSTLKDGDLIITALPPFLVDTYQNKSYRTLPLSYTQEFMNKKQYVWGNDINYQDLLLTYEEWLDSGKTLYISNAYITHHSNVIEDFESYKNEFSLKLVSSGCDHACDLFEITKK